MVHLADVGVHFLLSMGGKFVRPLTAEEYHITAANEIEDQPYFHEDVFVRNTIEAGKGRSIVLFYNDYFYGNLPLYNDRKSVYPSDGGFVSKEVILIHTQKRTIHMPQMFVYAPSSTASDFWFSRLNTWHGTK